jgi:heme exporter protein D
VYTLLTGKSSNSTNTTESDPGFFEKELGPLKTWTWFAIGGGVILLVVVITVSVVYKDKCAQQVNKAKQYIPSFRRPPATAASKVLYVSIVRPTMPPDTMF